MAFTKVFYQTIPNYQGTGIQLSCLVVCVIVYLSCLVVCVIIVYLSCLVVCRVKIDGNLPLIAVTLSDQTLKKLLKLFQSLPLPPPALSNRSKDTPNVWPHPPTHDHTIIIIMLLQFSDITIASTDNDNTNSIIMASKSVEEQKPAQQTDSSDCE